MNRVEIRKEIRRIIDEVYYFGADCGSYEYGTDAWVGTEYIDEIMNLIDQYQEESSSPPPSKKEKEV